MAERKKSKNFLVILVLLVLAALVIAGMTTAPTAPRETTTGVVTITIEQQPQQPLMDEGTVSLTVEEPEQSAT